MRHIAIVGSGPAGYYTAEGCLRSFGADVQVDVIDRLPVPYGLIRTGVAPDHQSIKGVARRFETVALSDQVRFAGNVAVGRDVDITELTALYDAVVLATGAPADKPLGVTGDDLPGVIGSAAFVGWYNGHPDFADLAPPLHGTGAVIVGAGNVALDVARILAKTEGEFAGSDIVGHALDHLGTGRHETITILARRGPHQIAMTPKELAELGFLMRATPVVDPADLPPTASDAELDHGLRKSVALLRDFARSGSANKPVRVVFDFFAMPLRIEGRDRAERMIVERTAIDEDRRVHGTGETYAIPASLVISCIGYRTPPIEGVPYDDGLGRFANEEGRIAPGLYAVGWARRGPTGTIGTNRPDGFAVTELIAADTRAVSGKAGRAGLDRLLGDRGIEAVTFGDWRKIEAAEVARARAGTPREKFTSLDAMLAELGRAPAARG